MPRNYKEEYQKWKEKFSSLTEEQKNLLIEKRREQNRRNNKKRREKRKKNLQEQQEYLNYLKEYRENNKEQISSVKKEWYKKNDEHVKDRVKTSYQILRENAIDELGGKCIKCGSTDNLEFNHIDPLNKQIEASGISNLRKGEYKKCELLCKSCHRRWSNLESSLSRKYWLETLSAEERRRIINESF
jgi:hypothetical protein